MRKSLAALLRNIVDYAGLYAPASLPIDQVLANYRTYRSGPHAWLLNRLVLPVDQLHVEPGWRITLIVEGEPGPLPAEVETLETKSPGRLSLPTYCEIPLDQLSDAFAKVRTVGLSLDAFTDFLAAKKTFKATAGLHHPIRNGEMHGFINVFTAATFAWWGADRDTIHAVLWDERSHNFAFDDEGLSWRGHRVTTDQITQARRDFAHSFGSCSFEEPIADLQNLGWIE